MTDRVIIISTIILMSVFICSLIAFTDRKRFNLIITIILNILFSATICVLNIYIYKDNNFTYFNEYNFVTLFLPYLPFLIIITKRGIISCCAIILNAFLACFAVYIVESLFQTYIIKNQEWTNYLPLVFYILIWIYMKFFYIDFQNSIDESSLKFSAICLLFAGVVFGELIIYTYLANTLNSSILKTELFSAALLSVYFFSFLIFKLIFTFYTKQIIDISNSEFFNKEALHIEERLELNDINNQKLKILKHDLKHILLTVSQLITSNRIDEATEYLKDYTNKIDSVEIESFSKNPIIDSILTYYSSFCQKNDIDFKITVDDFENVLNIPIIDFSVFISNCLENAVNATKKIQKNKMIKLSIINNKNRLVLQVANSFNGKIKFDANNRPITRRKNHGIGTTSIQWFVSKYGLDINYEANNNLFIINVLINTSEK